MKLYLKHWTPEGERRKGGALREQLLQELQELIPKPPLTALQRKVAEIGMQKLGCPHMILYLPARMPEWDPVEFVFAQMKKYFRLHRELRFDSQNRVAGMGVEAYRALLVRMWARFERQRVADCFRHVMNTYEREWSIEPNADEAVRQHVEAMRAQIAELIERYEVDVSVGTRSKHKFLFPVNGEVRELVDARGRPKTGLTPTRNRRRGDDNDDGGDASDEDDESLVSPLPARRGRAQAASNQRGVATPSSARQQSR